MKRERLDALLEAVEYEECRRSLYAFVKRFWSVVEPGSAYIDNWHVEAICLHLQAVTEGRIKRLVINVPFRTAKSTITSVLWPAWVWITHPEHQWLCGSYAEKLSIRDSLKMRRLVQSPQYRKAYGQNVEIASDQNQKQRFQNSRNGHRIAFGMTGGVMGDGGDTLLVDDPHDRQGANSEAERETTLTTYDEALVTRLNNPATGAIVIIMQRLHQKDLSGHVLARKDEGWAHLMIPMEFETARKCKTSIGWEDPRKKDGELMFPARFPAKTVESLKTTLGEYGCNPYEAPVLMADLSMKAIGEVVVGDEIIGFDKKRRTDDKDGRYKLAKATVLEVQVRRAKIVKMTLDSGEVIRCTRDHKWYMGGKGAGRPEYLPVTLGKSRLSRICPARLPTLSAEEQRTAGWLAGFFDGEGTVSICRKGTDGQYRGSASIHFFQGAGRNLPLCQKLEASLSHFGFEYSYGEDERKPNKDAPCYGYRQYRLKAMPTALQAFQRFLHIVQPVKWRSRIEQGALGSKFIERKEKVVSIEEDGEENVYALTTTTGNYVVWGLASSNSAGQLQQRPSPAGGGILRPDLFRMWPKDRPLPDFLFIVQSYDTAYTEKTQNDPTANTTWGVFEMRIGDKLKRQVMLLESWAEHMQYPKLRERLLNDWKAEYGGIQNDPVHPSRRADVVLIEEKGSGQSVVQDLRAANVPVVAYNPGRADKIARAHMMAPILELGCFWVLESKKDVGQPIRWARPLIKQMEEFPNGEHDDLVDTATQTAIYLRDAGMLTLTVVEDEHPKDIDYHERRTSGKNPYFA